MLIWNDHLISKYLWMQKKFTSLMIMIKIMTKVWFLGKMTLLWSPFSTHKEENCTEDLCSVQRGGIQLQLWYNDQPRQSDANPRNLGLNEFISGIPKKASSGVAEKVKAHCLSVSDINTTPAEVDIVGYDNGCQFQQCWCSSTFTIQYTHYRLKEMTDFCQLVSFLSISTMIFLIWNSSFPILESVNPLLYGR